MAGRIVFIHGAWVTPRCWDPMVAFFEARGLEGMRAFAEVVQLARSLDLVTIADAKRGDIGSTSAAYAEAFLGDGEFGCDAITVNPYLGSDALAPFVAKARNGRSRQMREPAIG